MAENIYCDRFKQKTFARPQGRPVGAQSRAFARRTTWRLLAVYIAHKGPIVAPAAVYRTNCELRNLIDNALFNIELPHIELYRDCSVVHARLTLQNKPLIGSIGYYIRP